MWAPQRLADWAEDNVCGCELRDRSTKLARATDQFPHFVLPLGPSLSAERRTLLTVTGPRYIS